MKKFKNIEPDFKTKPIEWIGWNMKTYDNSFKDALILLKQRQIVSSY